MLVLISKFEFSLSSSVLHFPFSWYLLQEFSVPQLISSWSLWKFSLICFMFSYSQINRLRRASQTNLKNELQRLFPCVLELSTSTWCYFCYQHGTNHYSNRRYTSNRRDRWELCLRNTWLVATWKMQLRSVSLGLRLSHQLGNIY